MGVRVGVEFHQTRLPRNLDLKFAIVPVRNPYIRALSCWRQDLWRTREGGAKMRGIMLEEIGSDDFRNYAKYLASSTCIEKAHGSTLAQNEYIRRSGVIDLPKKYVRVEHLDDDLSEVLRRKIHVPNLHQSEVPYGDWRSHYDDEIALWVQRWDGPTFHIGRYDHHGWRR